MPTNSKAILTFAYVCLAIFAAAAPASEARACDNWDLSGPFTISQTNKLTVTGSFEQVGDDLKGKASYFSPTLGDHGAQLEGDITGTVSGDVIQFTVSWYGSYVSCSSECVGSNYSAAGIYHGFVHADG